MTDLPPDAVTHLYPVLTIIAVFVGSLAALVGGLWVGFKWLHKQIADTSTQIVRPVEERVALAEKTIDALHRRMDTWMGTRK